MSGMRKWFWARKPDAGFLLLDYPATLLQALVFDEWVEARNECIDAVVASAGSGAFPEIERHYRDLGILVVPDFCEVTP